MATGVKSATYDYNSFGETIQSEGVAALANPFRFSTKYTDDETGLLYYGFRYYNPSAWRWLSRDPIAEQGGPNIYAFLWNEPIMLFDTDGRSVDSPSPTLAPEGLGSQWRDPATGRFTSPPQLPPPPDSGSFPKMPGSRDPANSVGGYGKAIAAAAKNLPKATLELMLLYGRAQCQKQQAYTGQGCACCVIRLYRITTISAFWGNQNSYVYGFAKVEKGGCNKAKIDYTRPEIVPYYGPLDTALARYFNTQTTVNQFYPW